MRSLHSGILLLLLIILSACSSKYSEVDELAKDLKTVTSWAATANMTGDAWIRGNVPTVYAKQALQKAQQEIIKETVTLDKEVPAQNHRQLLEQLKNLQQTVGQMSTAVEQENRTIVAQQIQQLLIEKQALNALTKTICESHE